MNADNQTPLNIFNLFELFTDETTNAVPTQPTGADMFVCEMSAMFWSRYTNWQLVMMYCRFKRSTSRNKEKPCVKKNNPRCPENVKMFPFFFPFTRRVKSLLSNKISSFFLLKTATTQTPSGH